MKKKKQIKEVKGIQELNKQELVNICGGKRLIYVVIDGKGSWIFG